MGRFGSIRASNLSVRSEVATGAGNAKRFFGQRRLFRLYDARLARMREVKRLRIVTRTAQGEFSFDTTVRRLRYCPWHW
jgi:hypothetical protein